MIVAGGEAEGVLAEPAAGGGVVVAGALVLERLHLVEFSAGKAIAISVCRRLDADQVAGTVVVEPGLFVRAADREETANQKYYRAGKAVVAVARHRCPLSSLRCGHFEKSCVPASPFCFPLLPE